MIIRLTMDETSHVRTEVRGHGDSLYSANIHVLSKRHLHGVDSLASPSKTLANIHIII